MNGFNFVGNEKKTNGKYILEVLVNNSDIFVQNWHPGVLKFSAKIKVYSIGN